MSKRKGLSLEEKRSRMMDFFYEKKDFFQLKELEKLCQKEKGITSMSVKEVLTSLVDDGMVDTDKIGTSVYFWAFPGKARQTRQAKITNLQNKSKELEAKKKTLLEMIASESKGKEPSEERDKVMSMLEKKTKEKNELLQELEVFKENDPELMEKMQNETRVALDAANRWTDNIFSIKSWIKTKFGFEEAVVNKQFGLPEDLDYLE